MVTIEVNSEVSTEEWQAYIRSGQMTRDEALKAIKEIPPEDKDIAEYCRNKLGLTTEEFERILSSEPKTFLNYSTYYPIIRALGLPIKLACMLDLFPQIFYEKYFNWDYKALKNYYSSPAFKYR